jgi:hypothetical protein
MDVVMEDSSPESPEELKVAMAWMRPTQAGMSLPSLILTGFAQGIRKIRF